MSSPHGAAVVIVTWNNRELIADCLDSVRAQTEADWHAVVVDNGSADGTPDVVRAYAAGHDRVTLLAQPRNLGFAAANNLGIAWALEHLDPAYLVLLNSDARLDPRWLATLVDAAERTPRAACLQGLTLNFFDPQLVDSAGILVNRNGSAVQLGYREQRASMPPAGEPRPVFGVNAAAALYTRRFLDSQPFAPQLFDPDLYMYLEDVDVAVRSVLTGWTNLLVPAATAYHMASVSGAKRPGLSLYLTFRNNALVLYKNFPAGLLRRMLGGAVRSDVTYLRERLAERDVRSAYLVVKARLASLALLPRFRAKRRVMLRAVSVAEDDVWQRM